MVTLDKGKVGGGEAAAAFDVQERPNGAAKNEGAAPAETDEGAARGEQIAVSEVSFTQRQARDQETFGND